MQILGEYYTDEEVREELAEMLKMSIELMMQDEYKSKTESTPLFWESVVNRINHVDDETMVSRMVEAVRVYYPDLLEFMYEYSVLNKEELEHVRAEINNCQDEMKALLKKLNSLKTEKAKKKVYYKISQLNSRLELTTKDARAIFKP